MAKKHPPKPQPRTAKAKRARKPAEAADVQNPAAAEPQVQPEAPVASEALTEDALPPELPTPEAPAAEPPPPEASPSETTTTLEAAPETPAPAKTKAKKPSNGPDDKKTSTRD